MDMTRLASIRGGDRAAAEAGAGVVLTIYGGGQGAPTRVTVLPASLAEVRAPVRADEWACLARRHGALPASLKRACWWLAVAWLTDSPDLFSCVSRLQPAKRGRSWIDRVERAQSLRGTFGVAELCRVAGDLVGVPTRPLRARRVRFGVAADGLSDLAFAVDAEAVPGLIDDLSMFVQRTGGEAWAAVAAFRQLVLIHPFPDGNGRVARWLAAAMAERAGLPRLLLHLALALFRAPVIALRGSYNRALVASEPAAFHDFVLDCSEEFLGVAKQHVVAFGRAERLLAETLAPAAFAGALGRRLVDWPVITVGELLALGRCSERNACRWIETFASSGGFRAEADLLYWQGAIDCAEALARDLLARRAG